MVLAATPPMILETPFPLICTPLISLPLVLSSLLVSLMALALHQLATLTSSPHSQSTFGALRLQRTAQTRTDLRALPQLQTLCLQHSLELILTMALVDLELRPQAIQGTHMLIPSNKSAISFLSLRPMGTQTHLRQPTMTGHGSQAALFPPLRLMPRDPETALLGQQL